MAITVIALIFAVIAFCLCKWGPESWGQGIFMVITGLLVASTPFGIFVRDMVVEMVNNIAGGAA